MQTLRNWSAKRSGATLTVTGVNTSTHRVERVTGVASVGVQGLNGETVVLAETVDGLRWLLVC